MVIQSRFAAAPPARTGGPGPVGWGSRGRVGDPTGKSTQRGVDPIAPIDPAPLVVDVALAPDAMLSFPGWRLAAADLDGSVGASGDGIEIRPLAPPDVRVEITLSADGEPTPARVRFVEADGRYLPPLGHREEINPAAFEDTGAGVILGRRYSMPTSQACSPSTSRSALSRSRSSTASIIARCGRRSSSTARGPTCRSRSSARSTGGRPAGYRPIRTCTSWRLRRRCSRRPRRTSPSSTCWRPSWGTPSRT